MGGWGGDGTRIHAGIMEWKRADREETVEAARGRLLILWDGQSVCSGQASWADAGQSLLCIAGSG